VVVARGTTESNHRIAFRRFEEIATDQVGILVGFEIGQPDDYLAREEGGGNGAYAFSELGDEILLGRGVARGQLENLLAQFVIVDAGEARQDQRVDLHFVGNDKFLARQPNSVDRQEGLLESMLRVADVEHHSRARARQLIELVLRPREGKPAVVY